MFNSHYIEQSTTLKNEIAFRDKYPTVVIDINKFDIVEITKDSNISFLKDEAKQVVINDNIKFVIHKDLTGLIQKGKFRFWYSRPDNFDRYVKLLMVESVS